jgi:quercetin dioxygenase-like cupin family protein
MTDAAAFTARLQAEGFQEILEREAPPAPTSPTHDHPFDARVLVLAGQFALGRDGVHRAYGPGEWFEVPRGTPHQEGAGPDGARLLVGRRHP